jgi:hypothetical protein
MKTVLCALIALGICTTFPAASLAEIPMKKGTLQMHFTDYEELYFAILDLTSGPDDDADFNSLPESGQALYIVAILDMEILNGGLVQFFANYGSAYALRTPDALRTIGLDEIAAAYESCLSTHQIVPDDLTAFKTDSIEAFGALYETYPLDDFDEHYVALRESLDFDSSMMSFAQAHQELFTRMS